MLSVSIFSSHLRHNLTFFMFTRYAFVHEWYFLIEFQTINGEKDTFHLFAHSRRETEILELTVFGN